MRHSIACVEHDVHQSLLELGLIAFRVRILLVELTVDGDPRHRQVVLDQSECGFDKAIYPDRASGAVPPREGLQCSDDLRYAIGHLCDNVDVFGGFCSLEVPLGVRAQ